MIMSDKRLKVCLRGAAVFLAVSIVFCIAVICGVNIQKSNMEKQRLDTETKLAEMQMPTFAPQSTEEVKSDGDGATDESNAVKTAADALGIDDVTVGKSQSGAGKKVIVLDAGHGKSSSEMTSDEKQPKVMNITSQKVIGANGDTIKTVHSAKIVTAAVVQACRLKTRRVGIQWVMPTEIQNRKSILTMPWRHKSILNKWVMKFV